MLLPGPSLAESDVKAIIRASARERGRERRRKKKDIKKKKKKERKGTTWRAESCCLDVGFQQECLAHLFA